MGRPKVRSLYTSKDFIPKDGMVCGFYRSRPFYVGDCDAHLFQMYPSTSIDEKLQNEMSHLAIHMGEHCHPPRLIHSRDSIKKAEEVIKKKLVASPQANACLIKNDVIRELHSMMESDLVADLSEEMVPKMWKSLYVVSTPQLFAKLL